MADLPLFQSHLLRLSPASRRDRFNGFTDDVFVSAYAARCFSSDATVLAFVVDGTIRGAAELHVCRPGNRDAAEIAFSVEDALQHRGVGAALFASLVARARAMGCTTLHVTTHAQNGAMKALARKFGASLCFQSVEAVGVIDLCKALPPVATVLVDDPARAAAFPENPGSLCFSDGEATRQEGCEGRCGASAKSG
nr:GNAT family N-acetyltransferase [Aquibium carbonis]